eukprot:scaffold177052_cov36-Tisochrysis_lutea.AAC.1
MVVRRVREREGERANDGVVVAALGRPGPGPWSMLVTAMVRGPGRHPSQNFVVSSVAGGL